MAGDNKKQEAKKNFPRSFFLFLLLVVLIVAAVQNFTGEKLAQVSFSYQLEPLENLDLIIPEDSRKTALNDNLVTFSGSFRKHTTEEGKKRFKFLELLYKHHELVSEKENLSDDLQILSRNIRQASQLFLSVSGVPIPTSGYRVVDELYDTPRQRNSIIVSEPAENSGMNLSELTASYAEVKKNPSQDNTRAFGGELLGVIRKFRSPVLGIGNETMKQTLRTMQDEVIQARRSGSISMAQRLKVYETSLGQLTSIVDDLKQLKDNVRLSQLRSVRDYVNILEQYDKVANGFDDNQLQVDKARLAVSHVIWYFNNQELSSRALEKQDPEIFSHWFATEKEEWELFKENKGLRFKAPDQPLNLVLEKTFKSEEPAPNYFNYLFTILPVVLVGLLLYFVFFRQSKGMGNAAMNFGKSPARMLSKDQNKITFKDVAGIEEAKEELQEIVDFLKSPGKFTALGGRIPKGVLCVGPPGTGKTLIAKAVAGEADRPFFSISGSDFVEMFVGVGASRIRDMFEQAKKHAPSIIFIDEIDAVGRHRGAGIGGGHDEREQTLNQLLVEMDGFDSNEGVILMAATNRPDVLDKALLRPGRFDRRIVIDLPDIKGRYEILKVHARKIKLDATVDLMTIARMTPGASGADLANLLNEAALLAARKGRTAVTGQETVEACDKVRYGKERRSLEIDEDEKKCTAYHESGHAVVAFLVEHADPIEKVTIIPRGFSLGATHFVPKKNRVNYWRQEVLDQLAVLMGGRIAEDIFIGDISSGAQQDIKQATSLARSMVCEWGMSDILGQVAYNETSNDGQYLGIVQHSKNYSEETAKAIDDEVKSIITAAFRRATEILEENKDKVELMSQMLVEFETLDNQDVQEIIDGKWNVEEKRERLTKASELHKKEPVTPPPPPAKDEEKETPPENVQPTPNPVA